MKRFFNYNNSVFASNPEGIFFGSTKKCILTQISISRLLMKHNILDKLNTCGNTLKRAKFLEWQPCHFLYYDLK